LIFLQPQDLRFIFLFSDIVGLENLQDQCLAQLKLRTLKGFNGLKLTVDLETEIVNGREFTRYMMPTGKFQVFYELDEISKLI
jgi:hypothetical protein